MKRSTTKPEVLHPFIRAGCCAFRQLVDPIESNVRARVRGFLEELIREELDAALARPRYVRRQPSEGRR